MTKAKPKEPQTGLDEGPELPGPDDDGNDGISLVERVENLENRMTALEERVAGPPIKLGKRL